MIQHTQIEIGGLRFTFSIEPANGTQLDLRLGKIVMLADVNAQPPLGIQGVEATDKGKERSGKTAFGALGIGGLKLKLHRGCIGRLFETSESVLDAEEIYALAKEMS